MYITSEEYFEAIATFYVNIDELLEFSIATSNNATRDLIYRTLVEITRYSKAL